MKEDVLGPYRLIRLLGQGGMGQVYLAHDPRLNRKVALKILSNLLSQEAEFRERFFQEARSVSSLNHPNITTIHEIGEVDGVHYIALEYVEGRTLESLIEEQKGLSWEQWAELVLALAGALEYAHGKGIVHRDLKPTNVLISDLGIPKILDFGLAKMLPAAAQPEDSEAPTLARLTGQGMVVGTIAYMSPEQALGQGVDHRSDVFSFGSLMYEMATGRQAFSGSTPTQVLDQVLHREPVPVEHLRPETTPEIAGIIRKALRKDPKERYQHLADLAADIRHVIKQSSSPSVRAPTREKEGRGEARRPWRWSWMAAAALVLVLAGLWAFQMLGTSPAPPPGSMAVMYFENLSEPDDPDNTGRMLASLLASELSRISGLELVSHQRLHDIAKHLGQEGGLVDRSVATEVARQAGVGTMVLGRVARVGSRIVATTELVDVMTGRLLASQKAEGNSVEDVFSMAEQLSDQVRNDIAVSSVAAEGVASGGGLTENLTSSVEAYRAFVRGESLMQEADFEGALEEFQEAVRVDPDFALAHFRSSIAARWLSDGVLAHQAARRAVAMVDKAPPNLRDVIRANALYQEGAYSQAIPLLEAALERDPNLKEGLYILSQIYMHSARDGDSLLAIGLMERLLEMDPEFHLVYDRLALAYAFRGDIDKARERLVDWENIRPDKVEGLRTVLATLEGQPEEALGFGRAFSWIEGPLYMASTAMLAARWDVALRMAEHDPDEWRADHLRAWSFRNRGTLHVYLGEFDQAVEEYRRAGRSSGFRVHEGATGGVPASALQALAELYALRGEAPAARHEAEQALSLQPESARGLFYAGRFALLDDDIEAAARRLETLSALPASSTSESAGMYNQALEAEIELHSGHSERAVNLLEDLVSSGKLVLDWPTTCSSVGAVFRESLVRAYLSSGEKVKAARALEGLITSGFERVDHPALYVHALYRLGALKMEAGDLDGGRHLLERFLEHWRDSTWELPEVEEARSRLLVK